MSCDEDIKAFLAAVATLNNVDCKSTKAYLIRDGVPVVPGVYDLESKTFTPFDKYDTVACKTHDPLQRAGTVHEENQ